MPGRPFKNLFSGCRIDSNRANRAPPGRTAQMAGILVFRKTRVGDCPNVGPAAPKAHSGRRSLMKGGVVALQQGFRWAFSANFHGRTPPRRTKSDRSERGKTKSHGGARTRDRAPLPFLITISVDRVSAPEKDYRATGPAAECLAQSICTPRRACPPEACHPRSLTPCPLNGMPQRAFRKMILGTSIEILAGAGWRGVRRRRKPRLLRGPGRLPGSSVAGVGDMHPRDRVLGWRAAACA